MTEESLVSHFDYYRLAKKYEATGRYKEAIEAYKKAIEKKKDYAHAWYYKALLHHRLRQYNDAKCCAETVLRLQPSWNEHVRKILADCEAHIR
ncbi:MAG: tetratricopeptide repeat protein [Candidatus Thorarchaeota archaeon]|nr:tetratricopeptide repeat protein [Candidatus Thorarchaeota archaeon]